MPTFRDVRGHTRLTSLLSSAVARGSLPPTLLFAGPTGIGKLLVAKAVAAALNCLQFPALGDSCGTCRSCDRIERNVHVDVHILEPDDRASIKIDVVREVLDRVGFRPFEGKRRVVIIRDADALEVQAQNALLKSLEEPPPGTVFILTSAIPGALLPTVRSRCMPMRFARLTEAEVADVLEHTLEFSAKDARDAAALADGSVGQAMALQATDVAVMRETALALLQQVSGRARLPDRLTAAATIAVTPGKKDRSREEVALILQILASMLRDIELLNTSREQGALANPSLVDELDQVRRAFHGDRARAAFTVVDRAIAAVGRNAGTKIVADWIAVQL